MFKVYLKPFIVALLFLKKKCGLSVIERLTTETETN